MLNPSRSQLILSAIGIVAVLWLSWLVSESSDRGIDVFARSGYWIMLAMAAAWLTAARATVPLPTWSEVRLPLVISAAGVAICFASTPIGFKVLSDETNLLSVSQSMYQHKTAHHPTMGKYFYENFHATFVSPPSRPLVFPFLLSLVHSVTGYHAWNAFVLNAAVLFALLFLICLTTQRSLGIWDAIAAVLLVLSHPIIQMTAASGGFDLLSALAMLGVLLSAWHHLRVRTPDSLALVWTTLLIYAQVRYESIIAVPLVMGFLILCGYVTLDMIQARFAYFAAGPLFLFPWIMQRQLNRNSFENPSGIPAFSVGHFFDHLRDLVYVNLDFGFFYPYDNLLNIVAVVLLIALLVEASIKPSAPREHRERRDFLALTVLVVETGLAVFLSHHMGKAGHPTQARFFIPLSLTLAGVPLLVRRLQPRWISSAGLLAISTALFLVYQPVVGESRIIRFFPDFSG